MILGLTSIVHGKFEKLEQPLLEEKKKKGKMIVVFMAMIEVN